MTPPVLVLVLVAALGFGLALRRRRRPLPPPTAADIRDALAPDAEAIGEILADGDAALVLRRPSLAQTIVAVRCGCRFRRVVRLTAARRERLARVLDHSGSSVAAAWLRARERDEGRVLMLIEGGALRIQIHVRRGGGRDLMLRDEARPVTMLH